MVCGQIKGTASAVSSVNGDRVLCRFKAKRTFAIDKDLNSEFDTVFATRKQSKKVIKRWTLTCTTCMIISELYTVDILSAGSSQQGRTNLHKVG